MSDRSWDRMVVITALHGERFHGWVPEKFDDPREYLKACGANGIPAELEHVRNLIGNKEVKQTAQGVGIFPMMALLPIDMFATAMKSYHVIPSAWYFPGETGEARELMEGLLDGVEKMETRMRLQAAGLHDPSNVEPSDGPLAPGLR